MHDMIGHDRTNAGRETPQSKLSANQVLAIRAAYAPGLMDGMQMAAVYGVSYVTVYDALKGKTWTHV
jgi:hypothetical protein